MLSLVLQSKDNIDPVMLWKSIFYGVTIFMVVFFSCEIGQRVTNLFEEITDRFDQLNWYLFPLKVQRLLPTIMINMNEAIVIGCFGLMQGNRNQLKNVNPKLNLIKTSYLVNNCIFPFRWSISFIKASIYFEAFITEFGSIFQWLKDWKFDTNIAIEEDILNWRWISTMISVLFAVRLAWTYIRQLIQYYVITSIF